MRSYMHTIISLSLVAVMLAVGRPSYAGKHAGHTHTEAGHYAPEMDAATSAYVDSNPPLWRNLGTLSYRITTNNQQAQDYFDQGLRLAYAFNHLEAQRAFRMAQKSDPTCAMCFWGEALVLGPNINAPMEPAAVDPAWAAITLTRSLAEPVSDKEKSVIEALAQRYSKDPKSDRAQLDQRYATAMGKVSKRFPDDDNIAVLYAESLMDLSPWDYWEDHGRKPKGHTADILNTLERVLANNPNHPGAIHYYIHTVEASDRPERAEPHARRLAKLMPGAGHLVHMPGHLYYRLGYYRDALEANRAAIAMDENYLKETGAKGMYAQGYYPHNVHFLMVSAQMAGDDKTALDAAKKLSGLVSADTARTIPLAQPIMAAPYFTHAQFSKAETVTKLADPGKELPYVQAMWHYARGAALASEGEVKAATVELQALEKISRTADFSNLTAAMIPAPDIVQIARQILTARIAQYQGDLKKASNAFAAATALEEKLPYMEPPFWYYPVRRSLGAMRFLQGDPAGAEREFTRSLARVRNDAWTLHGLIEVRQQRGNEKAVAAARQQLEQVQAGEAMNSIDMRRL